MPVTVVVGGQYGSEGKGKICAHLALTDRVDFMVRCGGPNSGHTVDVRGERYALKQVPSGFVNPETRLLVAAGALVNPRIFMEEVEQCGLSPGRVGIDENAAVIEEADITTEQTLDLRGRLGSTGTGVGAAVGRRVLREGDFRQAKDHPDLAPFTTSVREELASATRMGSNIVVEGTQGFGLSLYHARKWPYRTSRDTTAHSFLGEVGLGVRDFDVVMAIRTFPIRVAGDSGPLEHEVTWEDVQTLSGYPVAISEYTTTTKRLRRVARFDWGIVEEAIRANAPTQLALHGADYIDFKNRSVSCYDNLTPSARAFIEEIETRTAVPVSFIGTGPTNEDIIDKRAVCQIPTLDTHVSHPHPRLASSVVG
ncbi:MAG: adenylosuccinate synthetase [Chloroflexi bacterium]|nr:adenylosuccinate synthetase [Chloroflexota bacterium]